MLRTTKNFFDFQTLKATPEYWRNNIWIFRPYKDILNNGEKILDDNKEVQNDIGITIDIWAISNPLAMKEIKDVPNYLYHFVIPHKIVYGYGMLLM